MLSWIDRRCWQGTGRFNLPFREISVILIGKIDQLTPVMCKVLYHKRPNKESENWGSFMFWLFDKVSNPTKNERSNGENYEQKRF